MNFDKYKWKIPVIPGDVHYLVPFAYIKGKLVGPGSA